MKKIGLKIFLYLLRSLIYIKRALIFVAKPLIFLFSKGHSIYRRTLGFYVYKFLFIVKRRFLKKANIAHGVGFIDFLGQRWTLQIIVFMVGIVIMVPQSKLFSRTTEEMPGRKTLIYKIVGPGDQDFDIEEVEINIKELAVTDTRSWREGTVKPEGPGPAGELQETEIQEISGIVAGGSALSKPTILPGTRLPTADPVVTSERTGNIYHIVQPGEVISRISQNYGLRLDTVLWANGLTSRSYIRPGDKLLILPVDGVIHKVKKGENLSKIALLYGAKTADIVSFNKLKENGEDIVVGEELVIPSGKKPVPQYVTTPTRSQFGSVAAPPPSIAAPAGSLYIWPTAVRRITQYFGLRHTGVDIAGPKGTPLYAARAGKVIRSQCGWNGGYGCYVILDHGSGITTLYGHASELYVSLGDEVVQGQTLAAMGSTGRSTGPHIHFEVRINGRRTNPLQYVR